MSKRSDTIRVRTQKDLTLTLNKVDNLIFQGWRLLDKNDTCYTLIKEVKRNDDLDRPGF